MTSNGVVSDNEPSESLDQIDETQNEKHGSRLRFKEIIR